MPFTRCIFYALKFKGTGLRSKVTFEIEWALAAENFKSGQGEIADPVSTASRPYYGSLTYYSFRSVIQELRAHQ